MNACLPTLTLLFSMVVFPYMIDAQSSQALPASYKIGGEGNSLTSNVPLNEINIHAYRHFRKRWPAVTGETWVKGAEGYIVSFIEKSLRCQARFDTRGGFLYSLKYYAGSAISSDLAGLIRKKYPDYGIDVVTEITDGEKVLYLVKIESLSSVKTLSVTDGQVEVLEELINGGARNQ